jgi:hypothetical protein
MFSQYQSLLALACSLNGIGYLTVGRSRIGPDDPIDSMTRFTGERYGMHIATDIKAQIHMQDKSLLARVTALLDLGVVNTRLNAGISACQSRDLAQGKCAGSGSVHGECFICLGDGLARTALQRGSRPHFVGLAQVRIAIILEGKNGSAVLVGRDINGFAVGCTTVRERGGAPERALDSGKHLLRVGAPYDQSRALDLMAVPSPGHFIDKICGHGCARRETSANE